MRRPGLRSLQPVVEDLASRAAPATTLARVQEQWSAVAGPVVADEAQPRSESHGVLTVACRSGVWAHELALLGSDLLERLNAALEADPRSSPLRELRFVVGQVSGAP